MARTIADALNELVNNDPNGLKPQINKKAPLDSPALTGTPTAPTPAEGDNSKKVATTEFVTNLVSKILSFADEDLNSFVELIDQVKKLRSTKATSTALGMVKIGDNINVADGTISITKGNVVDALGYTPPESATGATLYSGTGTNTDGAMTQKSTTEALDGKLNKTDAATTYLTKSTASSTYLTKTDASSTYLGKTATAAAASKVTGGTVTLTGSITGSGSFNSSGNVSISTSGGGSNITLASSTGSSTTAGMTQKAITDALNNKANASDLSNKLDKTDFDREITLQNGAVYFNNGMIVFPASTFNGTSYQQCVLLQDTGGFTIKITGVGNYYFKSDGIYKGNTKIAG